MSNHPTNAGSEPAESAAAAESEHSRVVAAAGAVSVAVILSRLTGLVRESAFAGFFGAGVAYDAYLAAFRIPNLFRDLLAEGALSSAFVAVFSKTLSAEGRERAFELSNRLTTLLAPLVALLCLAGIVFAPAVVDLMFPGFGAVEGKKELAVLLTRIMMPFLLFAMLAAKAMGVLQAHDRFLMPSLASAVFNVSSLTIGLAVAFLVAPRYDLEPIVGMAVGALAGGLLQYLWQTPGLRGLGLRYRPDFRWSDPRLWEVLRLLGPAVLGAAAVQINVIVNSNFASQITDAQGQIIDGPVSWLGYAFRFMQLPLGLFGVAIGSATLPAVSRSAAKGDMPEFRETLSRSLGLVFLLTIPSAAGLIVLSRSIVGFIYERGAFSPHDTEQTAMALSAFCLGLVGYAGMKILTPSFYALGDVRAPATVSALSIFLNYGLNWYLIRELGWGHVGLALSTASVTMLSFLALFLAMRRKAGGVEGRRLSRGLAKILTATALMTTVCWASSHWIGAWLGVSWWARAADLAVSIPLGAAVLYGACRALGVAELELAEKAALSRLKRRGRR